MRKLSPAHRVWRMLPPGPRRAALAHAAALLAPRPDQPPPPASGGIAIAGELTRASGLGEITRLLRAGLDQLGVPAWGIELSGLPGPRARLPDDLPPGAPLLIAVNSPHLPTALLRLGAAALRGRRIVGYWAWELPTLPPAWRVGMRFVHEVWTLSDFSAAALRTILPDRVRRVRLCLAAAPPRPSALDRAAFGLPANAVVTLVSFNLASSYARKNPEAAIAAHRAAFGDRADRILLLKIGNPDDFAEDFARLRALIADAPNIRLLTATLPAADAHALTRAADIVLSLHRSEGFGLVPAEAMLLGRPVVATGWSGNLDFMDDSSAALVPYRLVPARDPRGVFEAPGAVWAEPDIEAAAAWLARLADDPALRAQLGARGQTFATARLGTDDLRAAVVALGLPCAS
jgi:glycosyltransferase involved in cell wall biosynthesis